VRKIPTTEKLEATVEGDIEMVDGVLRVTRMRMHYRIEIPEGSDEAAERALASYASKCPAYATVGDAIALESTLNAN